MFKKILFFCLLALLVTGLVVCKKKSPPKEETRKALREGAETVKTDVMNNTGGRALMGSSDIFIYLPLSFGSKKLSLLRALIGDKKTIARQALILLNSSGPWDTLEGTWNWNPNTYQWEHSKRTPDNSILFEWQWYDSTVARNRYCLVTFSNYDWKKINGEWAILKLKVDLQVDDTTYFLLDLKEVRYGSTVSDVRLIDVSLTVVNIKFTFKFDYTTPPTANFTFRFEFTNDNPWYQITFRVKDNTPPFGDSVIAQSGTYTDYKDWRVSVTLQEPDKDRIQLISGDISKKGAHAADIKSEKRYKEGYPYLYVWIEYPDGTKETPEELFGDLFPQSMK